MQYVCNGDTFSFSFYIHLVHLKEEKKKTYLMFLSVCHQEKDDVKFRLDVLIMTQSYEIMWNKMKME